MINDGSWWAVNAWLIHSDGTAILFWAYLGAGLGGHGDMESLIQQQVTLCVISCSCCQANCHCRLSIAITSLGNQQIWLGVPWLFTLTKLVELPSRSPSAAVTLHQKRCSLGRRLNPQIWVNFQNIGHHHLRVASTLKLLIFKWFGDT